MKERVEPEETESCERLFRTKNIYARVSRETMDNLFIHEDSGIFYFKEINLEDIFEVDEIEDVRVLRFKSWMDYNRFQNENPKLDILARSEQHAMLTLIVKNQNPKQP